MNQISSRQTKYCTDIEKSLKKMGHATNAELLKVLKTSYPNLSATTVHRATARLAARGDISIAPPAKNGVIRYDINTSDHDHFLCTSCDLILDINIRKEISKSIEKMIDDCQISGQLTINGTCKKCIERG